MVSRWCSMFINQKIQENGELSQEDISTLTDWVPVFFGIDRDVTKEIAQQANKGILQRKALALINKPTISMDNVRKLREELQTWGLQLETDLELTKPQLRC